MYKRSSSVNCLIWILTPLVRRADRRLAVLGASEEVINLLSDVMPRYEVINWRHANVWDYYLLSCPGMRSCMECCHTKVWGHKLKSCPGMRSLALFTPRYEVINSRHARVWGYLFSSCPGMRSWTFVMLRWEVMNCRNALCTVMNCRFEVMNCRHVQVWDHELSSFPGMRS